MSERRAIQTAGRIGGFCIRHFLALAVTVTAACALWTVAYFTLLLWAAFNGGGLGGPLAYPAGLILCFVGGMAVSLILLLPSTGLAEWLAGRYGFPILAQIPISVVVLALLCSAVIRIIAVVDSQPSFWGTLNGLGVLFLAHLAPLGLYWWTAQSGPLVVSLLRRLFFRFRWSGSPIGRKA